MKKLICKSDFNKPAPIPESGYSIWIEKGEYFTAPTVDDKKFGSHDYFVDDEFIYLYYLCKCGCEMTSFASSGPVDPFGACPSNPMSANIKTDDHFV
jgi:hypothetical protein